MQRHSCEPVILVVLQNITNPFNTEPTIAIHKLLKEILKAVRSFQHDPAVGKVIEGHQDVFGVPPNIHNLKEKHIHINMSVCMILWF